MGRLFWMDRTRTASAVNVDCVRNPRAMSAMRPRS
jgi:hypothetical protein